MLDRSAGALGAFIDAAPTPFHAVAGARRLLELAGFTPLPETGRWPGRPGRYLVVREGALVAWSSEVLERSAGWPAPASFTVVGGHTDSPGLRLKPEPGYQDCGWDMLGVEVYGGPLLASWFDRDLGIAGRAVVRDPGAPAGGSVRLFHHRHPVARVANLAIHLDRAAADGPSPVNRQLHLAPVWGAGHGSGSFREWLAAQLGVPAGDLLAFDAMLHDVTPCARLGREGDLLAAPRLDNLTTVFAGTVALIDAVTAPGAGGPAGPAGSPGGPRLPVLALFDHEEIGSQSSRGGASQLLPAVLERIVLAGGGDRADVLAALAGSFVVSADMAHAVHPNYAGRYEPRHHVLAGGGPVLKVNAQGRYATDAAGAAAFTLACERAGVPLQTFVNRTDLPCGSTIGPMSAALTGAVTADVGAPMLSMHSVRELMACSDVPRYAAALGAVLGAAPAAVSRGGQDRAGNGQRPGAGHSA